MLQVSESRQGYVVVARRGMFRTSSATKRALRRRAEYANDPAYQVKLDWFMGSTTSTPLEVYQILLFFFAFFSSSILSTERYA